MKAFFKGIFTALVTPFRADLSIDETALRAIVDRQIGAGIDGLVPCGTTGESPTLTHQEHGRVIEVTVEQAAGRVPVVAGTGSNSTSEAIDLTRHAKKAGADACLVVGPYYNKPTPEGLRQHFFAIADIGLPVIVYNIPGRTGINITPETMAILTEHPNIVGIKEATGSLEQMIQDIIFCKERATYLCGDDALTLPHMSVGGHGVISVISNLIPEAAVAMVRAARSGDWGKARAMHLHMFPLCRAMFVETNPIPIKSAMAMMGFLEPVWRLPMTPPSETTVATLRTEMEKFGLILPA